MRDICYPARIMDYETRAEIRSAQLAEIAWDFAEDETIPVDEKNTDFDFENIQEF